MPKDFYNVGMTSCLSQLRNGPCLILDVLRGYFPEGSYNLSCKGLVLVGVTLATEPGGHLPQSSSSKTVRAFKRKAYFMDFAITPTRNELFVGYIGFETCCPGEIIYVLLILDGGLRVSHVTKKEWGTRGRMKHIYRRMQHATWPSSLLMATPFPWRHGNATPQKRYSHHPINGAEEP
jgi:hypothetical protein